MRCHCTDLNKDCECFVTYHGNLANFARHAGSRVKIISSTLQALLATK